MASMAAVVAISLSACGGKGANGNTAISGITGPSVAVVNGDVVLSLTLNNVSVQGGLSLPIPKYPNSSLSVGPDFQSAGTLIVLTLNVKDFLGGKTLILDPQTLPGGRPLPTVGAGALPALALQIPQLFNTVLYLGPQVIGFFVPVKGLNIAGSILSFNFYNSTNVKVGTVSIVGADASGSNGGLLVLMDTILLGLPAA